MYRIFLALALIASTSPAFAVAISQLPNAPNASMTDAVPAESGSCTGGDCRETLGQIVALTLSQANTWTLPQIIINTAPTAFTGDYAQLVGQIGTTSAAQIYADAIGSCGAGCTNADAVRGAATAVTGSTTANVDGVAGYVLNQNPSANNGGNSVAVFGVGISAVNGAQTWGLNTNVEDSATPNVVSNGTGKVLYNELDCNVTSPNTIVNGLVLQGASVAQPAMASAVIVSNLNLGIYSTPPSGPNIPWNNAFYTEDGAATYGLTIGLLGGVCPASGPCPANLHSQYIGLASTNSAGTKSYAVLYNAPAGLMTTSPALLPSQNNAMSVGGPSQNMLAVWNQENVLEPMTVATLPSCNYYTHGAIASVTDATSTAYFVKVAGGGNYSTVVMCDGAEWVSH